MVSVLRGRMKLKTKNTFNHVVQAFACFTFTFCLAAGAKSEPRTTAERLLDRLQIEDLIIDYNSQLGGEKTPEFGNEYLEDGELVLGSRVIKGREAIKAMYAGFRSRNPDRPRPRMTVLLSNPRITVTGDTAHGEWVYTALIAPATDQAPQLQEHGREVDDFVKVDGEWKIKRREVINYANAGLSAPAPTN